MWNEKGHRVSGLRERKKAAARAALEQAALRLFAEKGYAATTVDDIATAADMSRSTFFRYFGSKEAVFFDVYEQSGTTLVTEILKRPETESAMTAFEEALVQLARDLAREETRHMSRDRQRFLESDPEMMARSREMSEHWERRIAEALARREKASHPTAVHRLVAFIGVAISRSVGYEWQERADVSAEDLIREHFAILREQLTGS